MKRLSRWAFAALAVAAVGCGSEAALVGGNASTGDGGLSPDAEALDGSVPGDDATLSDGALGQDAIPWNVDGGFGPDGGVSASCSAFGGTCASGASCCSGICDPKVNTCASSIAVCAPATAACAGNTDCCSGSCISGHCGGLQCLTIGAACPAAGNTCCTGNCGNGTCQPIASNPTCTTANNTCTTGSQCCSGLCNPGGTCALGSSYCIQNNDICYHGADCCGGVCAAPNGQPVSPTNPGLCSQPVPSGQVNCTGIDGDLCAHTGDGGSCGNCCSRLCAPYGPTGVFICQPAQGCRIEGDLCRKNSDCCGGAGSGVLGDGQVICSNSGTTDAVGVCLTPGTGHASGGTCNPEGDICHYTSYACSNSTKRNDCCGKTNQSNMCFLDSLGIPRCNALGTASDGGANCVTAGTACASASQCCNGNPCVPGASGQLQCAATSCQSAGQSCTASADCCPGLPCVAPPGSLQGTCAAVLPPPPPPGDGGTTTADGGGAGSDSGSTPDSGGGFSCALYGQSCSALPCCTGTSCISGKCSTF